MSAPINILKARLAAGEVVHGCWVALADGYAAEIAATAGFDWLLIDGEHAPNDARSISDQLGRLLPTGAQVVVRTVDDDPAKIKQMLDLGAQTLLIPMVESAEQARRAVRAALYPPEGMRGVGSALARASLWGATPDYLTTANAQICVMVQVESRAGLAALDAILAVDGLDGVFIGPSDLAADLGHPGRPDAPEVHAAVMDALRRIAASGLAAGVMSTDPGYVEDCKAAGAAFVGVGIDATLLAGALRGLAARWR